MVERDLVRMRQQIAALQRELDEKEQELKNKQKSEDRKKVQSDQEKGACYKYKSQSRLVLWEGGKHA